MPLGRTYTKKLMEALDRLVRETEGEPRTPNIGEVWSVYARDHVPALAETGRQMVRYSWHNLEGPFAALRPDEVTQKVVNEYAAARRAGKIGMASKDITIRRELSYLFAALRFAARSKLISFDDINAVELPRVPLTAKRYLTIEEIQKLLDAAASMRRGNRLSRLERYIWLALETAARKTAILRLTWDRVDMEAGSVDFREPGQIVTKKRRAVVPISEALRPVLERASLEKKGRFVMDSTTDGIWASMQLAWAKAFGGAPTPRGMCPSGNGIGPHSLRHTAATLMARNDVSLFNVAGVLGNSVQVTERTYAHHARANPGDTTDKISRGLLRPPKP